MSSLQIQQCTLSAINISFSLSLILYPIFYSMSFISTTVFYFLHFMLENILSLLLFLSLLAFLISLAFSLSHSGFVSFSISLSQYPLAFLLSQSLSILSSLFLSPPVSGLSPRLKEIFVEPNKILRSTLDKSCRDLGNFVRTFQFIFFRFFTFFPHLKIFCGFHLVGPKMQF